MGGFLLVLMGGRCLRKEIGMKVGRSIEDGTTWRWLLDVQGLVFRYIACLGVLRWPIQVDSF